jgi:hypothetical protein
LYEVSIARWQTHLSHCELVLVKRKFKEADVVIAVQVNLLQSCQKDMTRPFVQPTTGAHTVTQLLDRQGFATAFQKQVSLVLGELTNVSIALRRVFLEVLSGRHINPHMFNDGCKRTFCKVQHLLKAPREVGNKGPEKKLGLSID